MANNNKKYISLNRLSNFLDNLKTTFALMSHKHTVADLTDYTPIVVDTILSPTSNNPVANSTLDAEFEAISQGMGAIEQAIDNKANSAHNHDDRYYTETEIDTKLASKSDTTHNHDSDYDAKGTAEEKANNAFDSAKEYTNTKVADLASTTVVDDKIGTHNTSTSAHSDIRELIADLTTKLNNFLNVDDTTTDQLSEVLQLIENNKGTLESLTTSKVNVSDIVDNLTTASASKVLSAAQGVAIKGLIDALQAELYSHTHIVSNITDLTATATELNYMDGVTSNVQTQIDSIKEAKADWNQNDSSSIDYIKNRPFYETEPVELIIAEGTIPAGQMMQISVNTKWLKLGETYTAVFDGVTYNNLVCEDFDGLPAIGSDSFVFAIQSGMAMAYAEDSSASHSIKVISYVSTVFPLERKYIAEHIDILAGKKVEGKVYTIDEIDTVAENGAEIFNDYNKNIATGKYSHAEGSNTKAIGDYSHAEGIESTASGYYSHAEGVVVVASGSASHAEGSQTTASGFVAHAEGQHSEATNDCAHAEGFASKATGQYSHAQGDNAIASGKGSHAEGYSTQAIGSYSHAEGTSTIASGRAQHVQGKYNIEDASSETYSYSKYAHIVGNGTGNSARSNAHTLDWDGNAWFAGDVYVGSTSGVNKDEGSVKLLKEGDATSVIIREW